MTQSAPTVPSKKSIRRAGDCLRNGAAADAELAAAIQILSTWRSLYYRPINTFQALLRKKISTLGIQNAIVAQRLKRTPSIIAKLKRFPGMQLDRMQDIGGIRAIVNSVEEVRALHEALLNGRHKHFPLLPPKDYILEPKADGYRGIHQVFKFSTAQHEELEGMQIEVQIRTKLQHYWATAVETMGVIEKSSFKTGAGDEEFKQFFRLCSALFSIHENQPIIEVLRDKNPEEIAKEFVLLEEQLGVFGKLAAFTTLIKNTAGVVNDKVDGYYLLILNTDEKKTDFIPFAKQQADLAANMYTLMENQVRDNPAVDIVLAAAGDMKGLRKAYPNYFVDTNAFIRHLKSISSSILEKKA